MTRDFGIIGQHIRLSLSLFWRFGLVLTAIWAAGVLLNQILMRLAVEIGMQSRILGLIAIAPIILLQLLIFVGFFVILRNGLPTLRRHRKQVEAEAEAIPQTDESTPDMFATALLAVLIPFYGYYAGWGFLADTLRSYSQIFYNTQMRRIDFTQETKLVSALDVGQTGWVILAVLVIWVIRRFAKAAQKKSEAGFWAMLVVSCEATWALLGLYVISAWKDGLAGWLATLPSPQDLLDRIVPAANAAIADPDILPVDWPLEFQLWPAIVALFWYALLPLVWFNLGGIVYGHDVSRVDHQTQRVAGRAITRWQALPKPVTDFVGFFYAGLLKRWNAVANGVLLAGSAGFALTVSVLVLWRLVDWLGNWAWIGMAKLIGPQDPLIWQVVSAPLNLFFNAPGAPTGGLLVSPLQFCILAAGLELAGRALQAREAAIPPDAAPA